MKKLLFFSISFFLISIAFFAFAKDGERIEKTASKTPLLEKVKEEIIKDEELPARVLLSVPYVSEAPEKIWSNPWGNACEEASIMMVHSYYEGDKTVGVEEAKKFLTMLFDEEDRIYGSNKNTDADQTLYLINSYTAFKAKIKEKPTLDEIKKEINEGRPVIAPNYGVGLQNKNIPFNPALSSYHMSVVVGYDDNKKVFIVHDPGDEPTGNFHEYSYDLYLNAIHDYDKVRNKADGPRRVIFTSKE